MEIMQKQKIRLRNSRIKNSAAIKVFSIQISLILFLFSCTTQKELTYLNNLDTTAVQQFYPMERPNYKIQKQDILYVNIHSTNKDINELLNPNLSAASSGAFREPSSIFVNGYTVSDSGYITLPMIGDVYVYNLTQDEIKLRIKNQAEDYIKNPIVNIRLLTFKFTVIGEVNTPGTFTNFNNQLTILEAIGTAGDITDYGDRKKVLVLRPTKEGTFTYRVNLLDKNLLQSEGFFLLPNDIVIIEPIKSKPFQLNLPITTLLISTSISTISTLILLLNFINTQ